VPSHSELRRQAVAHMREHEVEFLPFFAQVRLLTAHSFFCKGCGFGFVPQVRPVADRGTKAQHDRAAWQLMWRDCCSSRRPPSSLASVAPAPSAGYPISDACTGMRDVQSLPWTDAGGW